MRWLFLLSVVLFIVPFGCGDDGDGNGGNGGGDKSCPKSFGQPEACGGDFEGSWKYVAACTDVDFTENLKGMCAGLSSSNVATAVTSGALSLASGSYNLDVSVTVSMDLGIPKDCASLVGGCAGAGQALQNVLTGSTIDCSGAGDCACKLSLPISSSKSGTLTTSGGIATLDTGEQYYYCVKDGVLRYRGLKDKADGDDAITYVLTKE
jgi:hypothetical protein